MNIDETVNQLEAILFAAGYPVTFERIAEVLEIEHESVTEVAEALKKRCDDNGGVQLVLYHDSCQLCTKEKYETVVRKALGMKTTGTISASLLEVLSIVAYNQPVTKSFIEQIRGVDCSYAVSSLCEKQLIECVGRLEVPGKPMIYATTDTFLRLFGLSSVADLPHDSIPEMTESAEKPEETAEEAAEEKTEE